MAPKTARARRDWNAPLASQAQRGDTRSRLTELESRVQAGGRINAEEALFLHEQADLGLLGRMADGVRAAKHPEPIVTYIVDRNLNPTNVCLTDCGFCAFYRSPGDPEAYVLSRDEIYTKVQATVQLGGQQLLMQGGHHPQLLSAWWGELISDINSRFEINCHALSAPELDHFSHMEKRPVEDVIADLKDAGLGVCLGLEPKSLASACARSSRPRKRRPHAGSMSTARCTKPGCAARPP